MKQPLHKTPVMNAAICNDGGAAGGGAPGGGPPHGHGSSGGGGDQSKKWDDCHPSPSLAKSPRANDVADEDSVAADEGRALENPASLSQRQGPSSTNDGADGGSISSSHRADLDRATQNSIRDSAGAYSVVPGQPATRREPLEDPVASANDRQEDAPQIPFEIPYDSSNLPPNIDIIAEATLVEDHNHSQIVLMTQRGQHHQRPREDDDDTDADTFGLHWDDAPREGGANDDSVSVAMSAITAPTFLRRVDGDGRSQTIATESECQQLQPCQQQQQQEQQEMPNLDEERGIIVANTSIAEETGAMLATGTPTVQSSIVVHATPINEGPFAFLETKGGKIAASIAVILIALLSTSIVVGLGGRDDDENPSISQPPVSLPSPEKAVLTRASGNFCTASIPRVFYEKWPTHCTLEEVHFGGTLQQAIADALMERSGGSVDVSILNAGAVRSEIPADSPVTMEKIHMILPFRDNTISYLELTARDLVRVVENAVEYASQEVPFDPNFAGAYPYASGLRFDVDLSSATEKVLNVQVYDRQLEDWIPLNWDDAEAGSYVVVTSSFLATGGDDYLEGTEPIGVNVTDIGYTEGVIDYLRNLVGDWEPPELDEMSTRSFVAP